MILDPLQQWYVLSKTLAERAAWEIAEKQGLDLVAMNPAMVVGDLLQVSISKPSLLQNCRPLSHSLSFPLPPFTLLVTPSCLPLLLCERRSLM